MKYLPGETTAAYCRRAGIGSLDLLAGDEGYGETVIRVTAIGEDQILARAVLHNGQPVSWGERSWTLEYRDWRVLTLREWLAMTQEPSA